MGKKKKLFTHIGSLGFIHNISYWIEVAHHIQTIDPNENYLLIFIGDGANKLMLEEEIRKRGINNIVFLGLKPKMDLPIWIQKSVATLFATLDNPIQNTCSPNKIFDSFAAGVPIIQTSTGWIYQLVEKNKCGVNIPLKDPESAAKYMLEFANDKQKQKDYGLNAKQLALKDFNRDLLAEKYLSILKGLIPI